MNRVFGVVGRCVHMLGVGLWLLIFVTGLAGCERSSQSVNSAVLSESAADAKSGGAGQVSVVDRRLLGVFAGQFMPSDHWLSVQHEYSKLAEGDSYWESLDQVPAKFRSFVYQDPLYGVFRFAAPNRLSIQIEGLYPDHSVRGVSVSAGNYRILQGRWSLEKQTYILVLNEPGTDVNDGSFQLRLKPESGVLEGKWVSKDESKTQQFMLNHYDASAVKHRDDAFRVLVEILGVEESAIKDVSKLVWQTKDVENLTRPQIRMVRNWLYARHGVTFESKAVRNFFESYDWYVPKTSVAMLTLNDVEKQNLSLLKRYESYAAETYNSFGR